MSLSKDFLVAFCLAVSNAKPLHPSRVARQEAPEPSSYRQYLNFNPEDEVDKGRLQKLHDVVCIGELRAIAARGAYAAQLTETTTNDVYNVFFDPDIETF